MKNIKTVTPCALAFSCHSLHLLALFLRQLRSRRYCQAEYGIKTIASHITHTVAAICAQASVNNSGFSFNACGKIGTALFRGFLSWGAIIFVLSSYILLLSGSRLSCSLKQPRNSSSVVSSLSELQLSVPGVEGRSCFAVPFCIGSVGFPVVVLATLPVRAGVVLASYSVGVGGMVPASLSVGAGGILVASFLVRSGGTIPPSFSVGLLVPSPHPYLARSIKSPATLHSRISICFPLIEGIGSRSIWFILGNGGGTDVPWLAGGIDSEMV